MQKLTLWKVSISRNGQARMQQLVIYGAVEAHTSRRSLRAKKAANLMKVNLSATSKTQYPCPDFQCCSYWSFNLGKWCPDSLTLGPSALQVLISETKLHCDHSIHTREWFKDVLPLLMHLADTKYAPLLRALQCDHRTWCFCLSIIVVPHSIKNEERCTGIKQVFQFN